MTDAATEGRETILVVEDEASLRRLIVRVLRRNGYEVLEAEHGDAALDAAARHAGTIDLLLTDRVMPGLSGEQLAVRLRESRPDLAIVLMSGYTDPPGGVEGGPHMTVLHKPFRPAELETRLRGALDLARSSQEQQ